MNSCKIILTTTLICLVSLVQGQEKPLPLPKCKNGFIVIAHRGSHLVKPENTLLPGFPCCLQRYEKAMKKSEHVQNVQNIGL